ncbi:MAG: flavodoxin family protein [Candidatus Latescibacteria bacterium]|jgi:multimeric flavodoxin WrbA|nr:flavodoxin family protein [Candidatus Latescibacterota bacterium]
MKILAVSGSPRKDGNTERLLKTALDIIESHGIQTEFFSLREKSILTCNACMGCEKGPRCILDDDFDPIFNAMVESDGFIIGSPVYFGSATGEVTAFLDRAGYVARKNGNLFSRKIGGPVVVARRAGQNFTVAQLLMWFMINGMVVPGSSYWNMAIGKQKGDVVEDEEGIKTIKDFAENLAWLCKLIKGKQG